GQIPPGHGDDERIGTGREQQPVIAFDPPGCGDYRLRLAVDLDHRVAGDQFDAIALVPGGIVDHDVLEALLPRKHGRKHDAVVIDARFRAEDHDLVKVRIPRENLFHRAATGHAVADDDQPFALPF